jgi:hypothetical protein
MYEIGDDLPTLGADPDRIALLKNPDLLQMAKVGRAAIPLDLLTYGSEDEQPSVFLLHEDARQSILAVFNWTEQPRSHHFSLSELSLAGGRAYDLEDVFDPAHRSSAEGNFIQVEQPAHSVKLLKIIDRLLPPAPPKIVPGIPEQAKIGEDLKFSTKVNSGGAPAVGYHWDFGDGTSQDGRQVSHAFTKAGAYTVRLVVDGIDGVPAKTQASVSVSGAITLPPPSRHKSD